MNRFGAYTQQEHAAVPPLSLVLRNPDGQQAGDTRHGQDKESSVDNVDNRVESKTRMSAFGRLPSSVIDIILQLADANTFASLCVLNRQWRTRTNKASLYMNHLTSLTSEARPLPSDLASDDLDRLRKMFAEEAKRNLFRVYRPKRITYNIMRSSNSDEGQNTAGDALGFTPSPQGRILLVSSSSKIVMIDFTWSKPYVYRELKIERSPIATAISEDGSLLVLLFVPRKVEVWDLTADKAYRARSFQLGDTAKDIALSPDHTALAVVYEDAIEIISLSHYTHVMAKRSIPCRGIESIAFSPDGLMILGTTMRSGKTSTTAIHAMSHQQPSDLNNTHVRLDKIWTSRPLFPNSFDNTSHAVILPSSMDGSERRAFAHDDSNGAFSIIDLRSVRIARVIANDKQSTSRHALYKALPSLDATGELAAIAHSSSRIRVMPTEAGIPEEVGRQGIADEEREAAVPEDVSKLFWVPNARNSLEQRLVVISTVGGDGSGGDSKAVSGSAFISILDYDIRASVDPLQEQSLLLKASVVDDLVEHQWSLETELNLARRVGSASPEGLLARFVNLTLGRTGSYGLRGIQQVANRGIRNVGDLRKIKDVAETAGVAPTTLMAAVDLLAKRQDDVQPQIQPQPSGFPATKPPLQTSRSAEPATIRTIVTQPPPMDESRRTIQRSRTSPEETLRGASLKLQNTPEGAESFFQQKRRVIKRVFSDSFTLSSKKSGSSIKTSTMSQPRKERPLSGSESFTDHRSQEHSPSRRTRQLSLPRFTSRTEDSNLGLDATANRNRTSSFNIRRKPVAGQPPVAYNYAQNDLPPIPPRNFMRQTGDPEKRHSAPAGSLDDFVISAPDAPPVPPIPAAFSPQRPHALRHTGLAPSQDQLASLYRRQNSNIELSDQYSGHTAPRAALGAGRQVTGADDLMRKSPSKSPRKSLPLPHTYPPPEKGILKSARPPPRRPQFQRLNTIASVESSLSSISRVPSRAQGPNDDIDEEQIPRSSVQAEAIPELEQPEHQPVVPTRQPDEDRTSRRKSWFRSKSSEGKPIDGTRTAASRSRSRGRATHQPAPETEQRISSSTVSSATAPSEEKQVQTPPTPPSASEDSSVPQRRKSWLLRRFSSDSGRERPPTNKLRKRSRSRTPTRGEDALGSAGEDVPPVPKMPGAYLAAPVPTAPVELPGSTVVERSNTVSRTNSSRYSPDNLTELVSPVSPVGEMEDRSEAYELPAGPWVDDEGPVEPITRRAKADGRAFVDHEVAHWEGWEAGSGRCRGM